MAARVIAHCRDDQEPSHDRSIRAQVAFLDLVGIDLAGVEPRMLTRVGRDIVRVGKLGEGMTDHLLARSADDAAVGGVDVQADVVRSAERHADGGVLERASKALPAVAKRGFQQLSFANVEQRTMPGEWASLLVAHEYRAII